MLELTVERLTFKFPMGWDVCKYDDWSFYRNQFVGQIEGLKGVDIIAIDTSKRAYLVEVKDYRFPGSEKPSELPNAVAKKVLCTLAAMLPAKLNGTVPSEIDISKKVLRCSDLRIVVHIEQSQRHMPIVDLADLKQKLKRMLRAVDPHLRIVHMSNMHNLSWTVA